MILDPYLQFKDDPDKTNISSDVAVNDANYRMMSRVFILVLVTPPTV